MLDSIFSHDIFQKIFIGNTVLAYIKAGILFAGAIIVLLILNKVILNRLRTLASKTETRIDDFVMRLIERSVVPCLFLGAFYFAITHLTLTNTIEKVLNSFAIAFFVVQATRFLITALTHIIEGRIPVQTGESTKTSHTIISVIRVVGWGIAIVFLLDNLGFNISAVVAGLGIGGVAVALAAQTICYLL